MNQGSESIAHLFFLADKLGGCLVSYLEAATKELEVRTALMTQELTENTEKEIQTKKEQEKQGEGMMRAPFGYCPKCGGKGISRSKQSGRDMCENNHTYPSNTAVLRSDREEESHVNSN